MRFLRRLLGLDFPDPQVGQIWRSRHSGRAIRVKAVKLSDCGRIWHIDLQHENEGRFIPIANTYYMRPEQWRRMLRDEGRELMGGGAIEPPRPWPRGGNVNPPPHYPRPPAPQAPPRPMPPTPVPPHALARLAVIEFENAVRRDALGLGGDLDAARDALLGALGVPVVQPEQEIRK